MKLDLTAAIVRPSAAGYGGSGKCNTPLPRVRLSTVHDTPRRHDHWAGVIVAAGLGWLVGVWMGAHVVQTQVSHGRLLLESFVE